MAAAERLRPSLPSRQTMVLLLALLANAALPSMIEEQFQFASALRSDEEPLTANLPVLSPGATSGAQSIIVLLMKFNDILDEPNTRQYYVNMIFSSMNSYYSENSLGKVSLVGDVVGWLVLPREYSFYVNTQYPKGNRDQMLADSVDVADPTVNFPNYQHLIMIFNKPFGCCAWSVANKPVATDDGQVTLGLVGIPDAPMGIFAHEFGHSLGLPHTASGLWSAMAGGGCLGPSCEGTAHFVAWEKLRMGWVPQDRIREVLDESVTLDLYKTESPASGYQVVKVHVSGSLNFYLIEVRKRVGFDAYLPAEGVIISWVDESRPEPSSVVDAKPNTSTLDDGAWQVGQTFTDASGLTMRVAGATQDYYTVQISTPTSSPPADDGAATTTLTVSASPSSATVNGPVTFSVTLRGTWTDLHGVVGGKQIAVAAWGTSASCVTDSGGNCKVTIAAPSNTGAYQVTADFAGDANFQASTASIVLNINPSGIRISVTITVQNYPGTFRLRVANTNNIAVCVSSADIAKGQATTLYCVVQAGTYRVEVYRYTARISGPIVVAVPPDYAFSINYADHGGGPLQPLAVKAADSSTFVQSAPNSDGYATTALSLTAAPNPVSAGSQVTFTATLLGTWHELSGVVVGKQVTVSGWGLSGVCTTDSGGMCKVTLTVPSTVGLEQATADFAGDANFAGSSTAVTVTISQAGIRVAVTITVRNYPGQFRLRVANTNNIAVCVATKEIAKGETATIECIVSKGTYRVEVYRYTSRIYGPMVVTVPPDYLFNVNYAEKSGGPIQPAAVNLLSFASGLPKRNPEST